MSAFKKERENQRPTGAGSLQWSRKGDTHPWSLDSMVLNNMLAMMVGMVVGMMVDMVVGMMLGMVEVMVVGMVMLQREEGAAVPA